MDTPTSSLLNELSILERERLANLQDNDRCARLVPQVLRETGRQSENAVPPEATEWKRGKSELKVAGNEMGHSGNSPRLARVRGSSSSTVPMDSADTGECCSRQMAVQLLAPSFPSDYFSPTLTAFLSLCAVDYARELNIGLITRLSLQTYQSGFPGSGTHARNVSIVSERAGESPMTTSSDVSAEDADRPELLDGTADDTRSISTAYRRRSRTQIFDSRDHGHTSFAAVPSRPSERRFRSIEESIPSPQTIARRCIQPMREHVVQRWKRFRRRPGSDSPSTPPGRTISLRLPGSGHKPRTRGNSDAELLMNDNAVPIRISVIRRPKAYRTHSAPVPSQHPIPSLHSGCLSIATRSAPLRISYSTLSDDEEDGGLHDSDSEDGASHCFAGEQRAERSLHTKSSSAPLQRVSTAGTTVFSPPIIAEARPNSEKLRHGGNPSDSSGDFSSGAVDRMSFL